MEFGISDLINRVSVIRGDSIDLEKLQPFVQRVEVKVAGNQYVGFLNTSGQSIQLNDRKGPPFGWKSSARLLPNEVIMEIALDGFPMIHEYRIIETVQEKWSMELFIG